MPGSRVASETGFGKQTGGCQPDGTLFFAVRPARRQRLPAGSEMIDISEDKPPVTS